MKVDQAQIQELYAFTHQHFVAHYDLQTELVDHLCLGIEDQWKENPSLKFNEALNREFNKFGVFGFQEVIEERTKAMEKKYLAIIWHFFKEYITLPKIMFTLFLIALCYTIFRILPTGIGFLVIFGICFIVAIWMLYKTFKYRKHLRVKPKRWILEDLIFQQLGFSNSGLLPIYLCIWNLDSESLQSEWLVLLISVVLPCFCLLFYIIGHIIPNKAEQLLEENYPEYKIV
jgi:hypothetical protein